MQCIADSKNRLFQYTNRESNTSVTKFFKTTYFYSGNNVSF